MRIYMTLIQNIIHNIIFYCILSARPRQQSRAKCSLSNQGYAQGLCRGLAESMWYGMYSLPYKSILIDSRALPGNLKREGVVGETVGFPTTKLICFLFIYMEGRFLPPYYELLFPDFLDFCLLLTAKMNSATTTTTATNATASTPATNETIGTGRLTLEMPNDVLPTFTDVLVPPELNRHTTGSNLSPLHDYPIPAFFEPTPIRASPIVVPGAPLRTFDDLYNLALAQERAASLGEVSRQLFGHDGQAENDPYDDPMDIVVDDVNDDEFEAINNAIQNGFVNTERGTPGCFH